MNLFVRKLIALPTYGITVACEGLPFDYNWNSKIVFCVRIVETGVMKMSFADVFSHLVNTFVSRGEENVNFNKVTAWQHISCYFN